ncbi:phage protease [Hafnia paralvei]|uniref:phage protease n=1 Tax=Hafnia paralvei TaxID=546367 RepID=UPI002032810E|nr:phage protease [Hafnia paralvei]
MKTQTASSNIALAPLSAAIAQPDSDGWCQLLPAGRVRSRDGRPESPSEGWLVDASACERIRANLSALNQPLLIDYDHQTLTPQSSGVQALAAGWVKPENIQWREGVGIFVRPEWTKKAQAHIDEKEYAYLSAVLEYFTDSGIVVSVRVAALTNDPGMTGMQAVAALSASFVPTSQPETNTMNEQLRQILAALGVVVPENGEVTAELGTAALSALTALKTKADEHDGLKTQVTALSAEVTGLKTSPGTGVDLTQYVPIETFNEMRTELAALSSAHGTQSIAQLLDKSEQEGRTFKSERNYLTKLGGQIGVAALSAQLDARQPIAALTTMQTTTTSAPLSGKTGIAALSADDLQAARVLGKTPEEFLKLKEEEAK